MEDVAAGGRGSILQLRRSRLSHGFGVIREILAAPQGSIFRWLFAQQREVLVNPDGKLNYDGTTRRKRSSRAPGGRASTNPFGGNAGSPHARLAVTAQLSRD